MALVPNALNFLYPDHEGWRKARINSKTRQHCDMLGPIVEVLGRLQVLEGFKQGPFGQYLGLHLPVTIHGKVLHSILKRQIEYKKWSANAPPARDDEMWFGLGAQQHRFGQVEFCLCSGLKMGKFDEGLISGNYTPSENSLYARHFENQPRYHTLFETFKGLTNDQGEDGLKMANMLVIGYILCTIDPRDRVPLWMFALVDDDEAFKVFPWGSYVYSLTLHWIKNAIHKNRNKLKRESENAGPSKGNAKIRGKKDSTGKAITYNLSGFLLSLQVCTPTTTS